MGDSEFLGQLIHSVDEAVDKLGVARQKGKINEVKSLKKFILSMQHKILNELEESR